MIVLQSGSKLWTLLALPLIGAVAGFFYNMGRSEKKVAEAVPLQAMDPLGVSSSDYYTRLTMAAATAGVFGLRIELLFVFSSDRHRRVMQTIWRHMDGC